MVDGEIARVAASYTVPGSSQVLNVFYWRLDGSSVSDASVLTALDTWFTDVWANAWAVAASEEAMLDTIDADVVAVDGTVTRNIGSIGIGVPGDVTTTDTNPAAVAGYIKANTSFPKSRGSKYVPGLTEGGTVDGLWTSTVTSVLLDLLVEWLTPIEVGASDLTPGIIRRVAQTFQPFSGSGSTSDVPAYQRRRKPNSGS